MVHSNNLFNTSASTHPLQLIQTLPCPNRSKPLRELGSDRIHHNQQGGIRADFLILKEHYSNYRFGAVQIGGRTAVSPVQYRLNPRPDQTQPLVGAGLASRRRRKFSYRRAGILPAQAGSLHYER